MSYFPNSRILDSLDFLHILQIIPRVAVSVINSGWMYFHIFFFPTLPRMRSAESTVLCIPTTIRHDCEVERTIINGWMQNKCVNSCKYLSEATFCWAMLLCMFYLYRKKTLSFPYPFHHAGVR
jgi:hypothetical protein